MAVSNVLGQRGSKRVTAAPWKSPMMTWSTVFDYYFRVADHSGDASAFSDSYPEVG